jgi:cytidine deaminase
VPVVDWAALRLAAREVMEHAYAPYSRFRVGAAGLV